MKTFNSLFRVEKGNLHFLNPVGMFTGSGIVFCYFFAGCTTVR